MEGFRKEPSSLREACGWDENWTVSEWPITNDRPTDCTLIIQRWYGNGGHLLCKVQTVPSHNRYCLLSNMPSTWLPHPLQWECGRQNARASLMSSCALTCACGNGELFYIYCSNANRSCNNVPWKKPLLLRSHILCADQVRSTWNFPVLTALVLDTRAGHETAILYQTHIPLMWHR